MTVSIDAQSLYDLLPAIVRIRDVEQGGRLKALMALLAHQAAVLDEDLSQLYDDQFIETCADWVAPYIGDLIGYRHLHAVSPRIASARAEIAHTIGYRRRKGTAAMLEQLAQDVTGWSARVVEFFKLLATTQYLNHLRPGNRSWVDLRDWEPLERYDTAFDSLAHTVDVRRIASDRGRFNIPNVGIFLFRLDAYPLTRSPAARFFDDPLRYWFNPVGLDSPLFNLPVTEDTVTHLATPLNVPMPISRRVLHEQLDEYYGAGKSVLLELADVDGAGNLDPTKTPVAVAAKDVRVCDLSDLLDAAGNPVLDAQGHPVWAHTPPTKIAIDPALGRIALPADLGKIVLTTSHYGFSADMGGGEYERADTMDAQLAPVQPVTMPASIQSALSTLNGSGVVEIRDSGRYQEALGMKAAAAQRLQLRAADESFPTIVLDGELKIDGDADSEVTLNGLRIIGGPIRVVGTLRRLRLQHCTLVPGSVVDGTGRVAPVLVAEAVGTTVEIDHCIIGGLRVVDGATAAIYDSIVDASTEDAVAYAAPRTDTFGGALTVVASTVVGQVRTSVLNLASNSIFLAALATGDPPGTMLIDCDRRQEGCVRFSYVSPVSRTPRRYQCQPAVGADAARLRPQFTSLRYGDPGYGQLSRRCAREIATGADDEAEMGAFHQLFQPQRETNLRIRLDEYLRVGLEAGIFYPS